MPLTETSFQSLSFNFSPNVKHPDKSYLCLPGQSFACEWLHKKLFIYASMTMKWLYSLLPCASFLEKSRNDLRWGSQQIGRIKWKKIVLETWAHQPIYIFLWIYISSIHSSVSIAYSWFLYASLFCPPVQQETPFRFCKKQCSMDGVWKPNFFGWVCSLGHSIP